MVKTSRGFTIVELLIVIVVISILAAITTVSFNGIQNRAARAAAESGVSSTMKRLALFDVKYGTYPTSINDCPNPSAVSLCLQPSAGSAYRYKTSQQTAAPKVEVALMNDKQFFYQSKGEATGQNEFLRYTDIAPFIDKYGLVKYNLEFDIKSTDISSRGVINVYMQNGSGTKYSGPFEPINVTTSFTRHKTSFVASVSNAGLSQAWLAFYGAYNTGNRPVVDNLKLSLAD